MTSKNFEYPNKLEKIFDKLNLLNLKAIIVGGFIRDFYLDKKSKDIDIEVYFLDSIEQLIPILKEFGEVYEVGKSFGVCKLKLENLDLDFSMPRVDNKVSNGHTGFEVITKKELSYKTAASRRDFTINTIGYDTLTKQILDPFNGLVDLRVKLLKVVNKNSFIEDPLRVFRAMSLTARFELNVEINTLNICKLMVDKKLLNELSKERIYEELNKLFLKSISPSLGFNFFKKINGLNFFTDLVMQDNLWLKTMNYLDTFARTLQASKQTDNKTNMKLSLALLCYHIDDAKTISFIKKITNEKNLSFEILELIKSVNILKEKEDTYSLRKLATKVSFRELFKLADALGVKTKYKKAKVDKLGIMTNPLPNLIQGRDLIALGLKPSPKFSKILEVAYEHQLASKFDNKADAIKWLRKYLSYL